MALPCSRASGVGRPAALAAYGRRIGTPPFGRTFVLADPDGYRLTLHDRG